MTDAQANKIGFFAAEVIECKAMLRRLEESRLGYVQDMAADRLEFNEVKSTIRQAKKALKVIQAERAEYLAGLSKKF